MIARISTHIFTILICITLIACGQENDSQLSASLGQVQNAYQNTEQTEQAQPSKTHILAVEIGDEAFVLSYKPKQIMRILFCAKGHAHCSPAFRTILREEFVLAGDTLAKLEEITQKQDLHVLQVQSRSNEGSLNIQNEAYAKLQKGIAHHRNYLVGSTATGLAAFVTYEMTYNVERKHFFQLYKNAPKPKNLPKIMAEAKAFGVERMKIYPKIAIYRSLLVLAGFAAIGTIGYSGLHYIIKKQKEKGLSTSVAQLINQSKNTSTQLIFTRLITNDQVSNNSEEGKAANRDSNIIKNDTMVERISEKHFRSEDVALALLGYLRENDILEPNDPPFMCSSVHVYHETESLKCKRTY